ncbi:MAG: ABC transporter permease [Capnocytophaga sp.]|nr:ABC transporter permease [Capnocytophaga sp.]
MYKLLMSIRKEFLLLSRDIGGLVILFVMPLLLIITITLIQDGAYRNISEQKISILMADNDRGEMSKKIQENLNKSGFFEIITHSNGKPIDEEVARKQVLEGKHLMAIIIPDSVSTDLQTKVQQNIQLIINSFSGEEKPLHQEDFSQKEVRLYFDPTVQTSFKENIKNAIDKMVYQIENQFIYKTLEKELNTESPFDKQEQFLTFKEINPKAIDKEIIPNSVQHNVPAWALFAIFFIVIPLSTNIIKEKTQGTELRLFTSPISLSILMLAKTITYLIISILQFVLMVLVGIFILPMLGLPQLDISGKVILLLLIALVSGLSAIGIGILLGSFLQTQEQAAPLGATLTVILAAIGGVWIPTFAMPSFMQTISNISPMNWALQAFYDVLLREGNFSTILLKVSLLLSFSFVCIFISIMYEKSKRNL